MVVRQVPPKQALGALSARAPTEDGRAAQRRRTRRALVEAAVDLLSAGGPPPTIDAVAAKADVSRRTVYTYFPTLDQLLLDAALGALSEVYVDTALETADAHLDPHGQDVTARVSALIRAVLDLGDTTLPLGRHIIRLTVDQGATPSTGASTSSGPRRGARRTGWIEAAIAPLAPRLTPEQHDRLVSGLSLVVGFEAMIVLRDVRGLDAETEAHTSLWAAQAMVEAMIRELDPEVAPSEVH